MTSLTCVCTQFPVASAAVDIRALHDMRSDLLHSSPLSDVMRSDVMRSDVMRSDVMSHAYKDCSRISYSVPDSPRHHQHHSQAPPPIHQSHQNHHSTQLQGNHASASNRNDTGGTGANVNGGCQIGGGGFQSKIDRFFGSWRPP